MLPIKSHTGALTLPPGSAEQLSRLHAEEEARYAAPDAAFVYTLRDGSHSTVAPLGASQHSTTAAYLQGADL